MEYADNGDLF